MRRILTCAAFALTFLASAQAAHADGFTDTAPTVTCAGETIDPPFHFVVRFAATDNGTPSDGTVGYGTEHPHLAIWAHPLAPGVHHVVTHATMRGAVSHVADVTVTCPAPSSSSSSGILSLPFTGGDLTVVAGAAGVLILCGVLAQVHRWFA